MENESTHGSTKGKKIKRKKKEKENELVTTANPMLNGKKSLIEVHNDIVSTRGRSDTGVRLKSQILQEIDKDNNLFKFRCGRRRVLFLTFNFILICTQATIIIIFTSTPTQLLGRAKSLEREELWVFILFFLVLTSIFVKHACCFRIKGYNMIKNQVTELRTSVVESKKKLSLIEDPKQKNLSNTEDILKSDLNLPQKEEGGESALSKGKEAMATIVKLKKSFDMSGKYFLLKMAFFETFEDLNQFYNVATIHLCSLPLGIVIILLCGIFAEVTYRSYTYGKSITKKKTTTIVDSNNKGNEDNANKNEKNNTKNYNSWKIRKSDSPYTPAAPSIRPKVSKKLSLSEKSKMTLISIGQRNKQVFSDMLLDAIFLILPIGALYLYNIDLAIVEVVWLVLMPTISLASKLNDLLDEDLKKQMDKTYNTVLSMKFNKKGHQRASYMGLKRMEIICAEQNKHFPKSAKQIFFAINSSLSLVTIVMILFYAVQWALVDQSCNESLGKLIWEKSCHIKVPFCNSVFEPTCDCCSFYLDGHNYTQLPNGVEEFTAIRRFVFKHGNLKDLPKTHIEKWNRVNSFDVSNNKLLSFQINVSTWPSLVSLNLRFNSIKNMSTEIWTHKQVVNLQLNSNTGLSIPSRIAVQIHMPMLRFLSIANNSISLPSHFGKNEFPNLGYLYMNNNNLNIFPENFNTLNTRTLTKLSLASGNISHIPQFIHKFNNLQLLDFRDNDIKTLTSEFSSWLKKKVTDSKGDTKKFEQLFAYNPICNNNTVADKNLDFLDCEPVCSVFCFSRNALGDGQCDFTCNSKECKYDEGDCLYE